MKARTLGESRPPGAPAARRTEEHRRPMAAGTPACHVAEVLRAAIGSHCAEAPRPPYAPEGSSSHSPDAAPAVTHLIANVAGLASALGISEKLTKEMLNDSSTLNSLTTQWSAFADRPTTYCFTSPDDSVVSLQSAMFGCDRSMTYPLWSHTEMVKPPKSDDPRYVEPIGIVQKFIATKSSPTPR